MIPCTSHLIDSLCSAKTRTEIAKRTANEISHRCPAFEAIAIRGFSGAIVGTLVATYLDKPLIIVRHCKTIHTENMVEYGIFPTGKTPVIRYVIVDDLIATGNSIKEITSRIQEDWGNKDIIPVGIALYQYPTYRKYFNDTATKIDIPIWNCVE